MQSPKSIEFNNLKAEFANLSIHVRVRAEKSVIIAANYGLVDMSNALAKSIADHKSCIHRIVFLSDDSEGLLGTVKELEDITIAIIDLDNQIQLKTLELSAEAVKASMAGFITLAP